MALALAASGTLTADGTEQTLTTLTTGKTFVLVTDLAAMVNGDVVELRIKTKCLTGGTERQAYVASYANVQASPITYSVPVPANISFVATLKQTGAGYRNFPWAVLSLD